MGEWQPIETAPKTGACVILGSKDAGSWSGYWEDIPNHWGEIGWQDECVRGQAFAYHPDKPTHWQDFPEPPQ